MAILLTLEESDNQIVVGIPESVVLTTNIPSTIFYTLDGSAPDEDSDIFIDILYFPTDVFSVTLRAYAAVDGDTSSELEEVWSVSQVKLNRGRLIDDEGINILKIGTESVNNLSFDEDGADAQTSAIEFQDLDLKTTTRDNLGQDLPIESTISFINFARETALTTKSEISRPESIRFDPTANYIIMSGFTDEDLRAQVIQIVNRSHGTLELVNKKYRKQGEYNLTTSGLIRTMMNPSTGKITFYYRDSRDNRWLVSTQQTEIPQLNLTPIASPPNSFVFKWIEHRHGSKIY